MHSEKRTSQSYVQAMECSWPAQQATIMTTSNCAFVAIGALEDCVRALGSSLNASFRGFGRYPRS